MQYAYSLSSKIDVQLIDGMFDSTVYIWVVEFMYRRQWGELDWHKSTALLRRTWLPVPRSPSVALM